MKYDPARHHRRSIRLKGYDYTQAGAYFVTIVAQDRACVFGKVVNEQMRLNEFGAIVAEEWAHTAEIRPNVTLDTFIVMPNHTHGIIVIHDGRDTLQRVPTNQHARTVERFGKPTSNSIPTIVRLFKSATTKRINAARGTPGASLWQRNYFERIVRNDDELNRIHQYIIENPSRWQDDQENPNRLT